MLFRLPQEDTSAALVRSLRFETSNSSPDGRTACSACQSADRRSYPKAFSAPMSASVTSSSRRRPARATSSSSEANRPWLADSWLAARGPAVASSCCKTCGRRRIRASMDRRSRIWGTVELVARARGSRLGLVARRAGSVRWQSSGPHPAREARSRSAGPAGSRRRLRRYSPSRTPARRSDGIGRRAAARP